MRFDVVLTNTMVERELCEAEQRLGAAGLLSHEAWRPTPVCDVSHLVREVGEHRFVYLKDARLDRVVGVFSFQFSPVRRGPVSVALPHGKIAPDYRGFGLASWVYRNVMLQGASLMSSARQSAAAARVWARLAREFAHGYVWVERRSARYLGANLNEAEVAQLEVRRLLSPQGVDPVALWAPPQARVRRG